MNKTIQPIPSPSSPSIPVPYGWCRTISEHNHQTVYYISPSGRVFLTPTEINEYLQQSNSCKCYLTDINEVFIYSYFFLFKVSFLNVIIIKILFNFDPNIASFNMVPPSPLPNHQQHQFYHKSRCLSWVAANLTGSALAQELDIFLCYFRDQLLCDPLEKYQSILCRLNCDKMIGKFI